MCLHLKLYHTFKPYFSVKYPSKYIIFADKMKHKWSTALSLKLFDYFTTSWPDSHFHLIRITYEHCSIYNPRFVIQLKSCCFAATEDDQQAREIISSYFVSCSLSSCPRCVKNGLQQKRARSWDLWTGALLSLSPRLNCTSRSYLLYSFSMYWLQQRSWPIIFSWHSYVQALIFCNAVYFKESFQDRVVENTYLQTVLQKGIYYWSGRIFAIIVWQLFVFICSRIPVSVSH